MTVTFPDEASMENFSSQALDNSAYVITELFPGSLSVAFAWNITVPFGTFSSTEMLKVLLLGAT